MANPGRYGTERIGIPVFWGRFAMAEDENAVQQLFAHIRAFGWHEKKRASNLRDHKIDFET